MSKIDTPYNKNEIGLSEARFKSCGVIKITLHPIINVKVEFAVRDADTGEKVILEETAHNPAESTGFSSIEEAADYIKLNYSYKVKMGVN